MSDWIEPTLRAMAVPALTIGTTVILFWLKFYADARKRLDDLLLDLEHELYLSNTRETIFRNRYLEIRKAATEFDRWLLDPSKKRDFQDAFRKFRGQSFTNESIYSLRGTPHEQLIDVFLTSSEVRCLAPRQQDFSEYFGRIARLRKFTGSRKWADQESWKII